MQTVNVWPYSGVEFAFGVIGTQEDLTLKVILNAWHTKINSAFLAGPRTPLVGFHSTQRFLFSGNRMWCSGGSEWGEKGRGEQLRKIRTGEIPRAGTETERFSTLAQRTGREKNKKVDSASVYASQHREPISLKRYYQFRSLTNDPWELGEGWDESRRECRWDTDTRRVHDVKSQ